MTRAVVSGAGIAGLLLAISLQNIGLECDVLEQAPGFEDGVGGAIGLYPNGLRVIRDISPTLLSDIRKLGRPYKYRKWMRHDGTIIAQGEERFITKFENETDEIELASLGIRRWRLQKVLIDEAKRRGIKVILNQRVENVSMTEQGRVVIKLLSGSNIECDLLFGCDGVKSATRQSLFGNETEPKYTVIEIKKGITCLMGSAPIAKNSEIEGICFPSSSTTNCHACFYPANEKEIIFQLFFPTEEKPETWKALSKQESDEECKVMQKQLINDGWHKMFTDPVGKADSVLRVGLRARAPIPSWHYPSINPKVFLLGDAAHPPVPYIGQGAMMAIEDVGILTLLLQKMCKPTKESLFNFTKLDQVAQLYENLRIPRTSQMLAASQALGDMQLSRGQSSWIVSKMKELSIWINVQRYGTLPIMFQGAGYNYSQEVMKALEPKAKL